MLSLLMRLVKKIFGKVLQSHIIAVKTVRHGQIDEEKSSGLIWLLMVASKSWWWFWHTYKVDMVKVQVDG